MEEGESGRGSAGDARVEEEVNVGAKGGEKAGVGAAGGGEEAAVGAFDASAEEK